MLRRIADTFSDQRGCKPYSKLQRNGVYQSERTIYRDEFTHTLVWKMTHDPNVDRHFYYDMPAWNTNGSKILFMSTRPGSGFWIMDANGSNIRELNISTEEMTVRPPILWGNRNPNRIFLAEDDDGKTNIFSMNILTRDILIIGTIFESGFGIMPPSPDDKKIILRKKVYGIGGKYEADKIFVLDVDSGLIREVPIGGRIHRIRFTKAGDYSIFFNRNNPRTMWRTNADGSGLAKLRDGGSHPDWSPDGSRCSFFHHGLRIIDRKGANEKIIIDDVSGHGGWTYDGEWLVADVPKDSKSPYAGKIVMAKVDGNEIHEICYHKSSYQGHGLHPYSESTHPDVTASQDATKVIFDSDMHGTWSDVYVAVTRYPDPPAMLEACIEGDKAILNWGKPDRNKETAGYNIYRSETSGMSFVQISFTPVEEQKFADDLPINNSALYYVVTALEHSGLESRFSNEVCVSPKEEWTGPIRHWYEAESGHISGNATRVLDGRASEGYYVSSFKDGRGSIHIPVNIPVKSKYSIWIRTCSKDGIGRLAVTVDRKLECVLVISNKPWRWKRLQELFALESGEHHVLIKTDGKGLAVDNILVTTDEDYAPSLLGGSRDTTPPEKLRGLRVERAGIFELFITWQANSESDVDHYNIYRSTGPDFKCKYETLIASPIDNKYLDRGLKSSTSYYSPSIYCYRVTAVDRAANESVPSEVACAKTGGRSGHVDWE